MIHRKPCLKAIVKELGLAVEEDILAVRSDDGYYPVTNQPMTVITIILARPDDPNVYPIGTGDDDEAEDTMYG